MFTDFYDFSVVATEMSINAHKYGDFFPLATVLAYAKKELNRDDIVSIDISMGLFEFNYLNDPMSPFLTSYVKCDKSVFAQQVGFTSDGDVLFVGEYEEE